VHLLANRPHRTVAAFTTYPDAHRCGIVAELLQTPATATR
jgi:hypothetical protein